MTAFVLPTYSASPAVRHAAVDGLRVLLDVRTARYRVLDDAASALWAVLIGVDDADASFDRVAASYDVDERRFQAALDAFAARCIAEGLLERASPAQPASSLPHNVAPPSRRTIVPPTLRALTALIATQRALAGDGFGRTYERYALLAAASAATSLREALASFVRAENLFVARRAPDDCLARSLALYRFLRSVGVGAVHVIGVRRFPFAAHAWVECDGAEILADTSFGFTPLARIGEPFAARSGAA